MPCACTYLQAHTYTCRSIHLCTCTYLGNAAPFYKICPALSLLFASDKSDWRRKNVERERIGGVVTNPEPIPENFHNCNLQWIRTVTRRSKTVLGGHVAYIFVSFVIFLKSNTVTSTYYWIGSRIENCYVPHRWDFKMFLKRGWKRLSSRRQEEYPGFLSEDFSVLGTYVHTLQCQLS
jgi:hypothetical protein